MDEITEEIKRLKKEYGVGSTWQLIQALQQQVDCKSGNEECSLYNESGVVCYRHLYAAQQALQQQVEELKENIIDIIDSENSGVSAEQRIDEIKQILKEWRYAK